MLRCRPPAVAGSFYPAAPDQLTAIVDQLLEDVGTTTGELPKVLVVPHAGYIYSGSTAARAYARLAAGRQLIRRVVLLGPTHRVALRGLALPACDRFATPLGEISLDREAIATLRDLPQVVVSERVHAEEHSLEVHLPFLQRTLDAFRLVPLAVGQASPQDVAEVLNRLWGGPETLIVISSDLSHFLPYADARRADDDTCRDILDLATDIRPEQACGAFPLNGLLRVARQRALVPELLYQCNSGDTAGDRHRVVGYAAFAFREPVADPLGTTLLNLARNAIAGHFGQARRATGEFPALAAPGATFVTLTQNGQLRGCIGSLEAWRPLAADVQGNALAAAFRDPRFPPLTADELARTRIEVSLLTPPEAMPVASEAEALANLRPLVDGLIFSAGNRRATFLPQVWEQLPNPADFMAHLKQKAGLPATYWGDDVRLERYQVRKWQEGS